MMVLIPESSDHQSLREKEAFNMQSHDKTLVNVTDKPLPEVSATHSMSLLIDSAAEYRELLLNSFIETYKLYEQLFACVKPEGLFRRADPLRHPLIFYYGHTAVFAMNKLIVRNCLSFKERIDKSIESLMAIGVDEMSWDDLLPDTFDWPTLEEVSTYRQKVFARVTKYIKEELVLQDHTQVTWEHPAWIVLMAIEHERIHLETSAVLIRQLPLEFINVDPKNIFFQNICKEYDRDLDRVLGKFVPSNSNVEGMLKLKAKGKSIHYGRDCDKKSSEDPDIIHAPFPRQQLESYGWDNEYGSCIYAFEDDFYAGKTIITNAEFYAFVKDGGYSKLHYWSEEGKKWLAFTHVEHPRFWVPAKGGFVLRMMLEETKEMPWDWPIECNYLEAFAFIRYKSEKTGLNFHLPSEAEYHFMLYSSELQNSSFSETSQQKGFVPLIKKANIGLQFFSSSCPVTMHSTQLNDSDVIYDLSGNVWQHSRTTFHPLHGFRIHPAYDDFSVATFNDRHNLILGGSWISVGNEASLLSRYAFRRHFYQFAGFRLILHPNSAKINSLAVEFETMNNNFANSKDISSANIYETDTLVNQYIHFHFGTLPNLKAFEEVKNFPEICADICLALLQKQAASQKDSANSNNWRVFDLGAGVCRSTFELAKHDRVKEAVGMDFSTRFIQVAEKMKNEKRIRYSTIEQGNISMYREASFVDLPESTTISNNNSSVIPLDGKACQPWIATHFGLQLAPFITEPLDSILEKCRFLQGDACNLSLTHQLLAPSNPFDLILAANLIDRLYDPCVFLITIGTRIKRGGFLVLTSPYTWLEEFTKKENWIGGKRINGENVTTLDALTDKLAKDFVPVDLSLLFDKGKVAAVKSPKKRKNSSSSSSFSDMASLELEGNMNNAFSVPFAIRETERKFQYSRAQVSIWKKI